MCCTIWYHLHILKIVKNTHGGVLLLVKVTLLHRCFLRFLNVQMLLNRATHHILEYWKSLKFKQKHNLGSILLSINKFLTLPVKTYAKIERFLISSNFVFFLFTFSNIFCRNCSYLQKKMKFSIKDFFSK